MFTYVYTVYICKHFFVIILIVHSSFSADKVKHLGNISATALTY